MIRNVELSVFRFVAFGSNRGVPGEHPDDRENGGALMSFGIFSSAGYARTGNKSSVGPAPGFRHPYYGSLYSVGVYGFSWSSSASGSNGYYLDFNYSRIGPNYYGSRADGLQLRCLQE